MVDVFGNDNIFGKLGNVFINQGKVGQALSLGDYIAKTYGGQATTKVGEDSSKGNTKSATFGSTDKFTPEGFPIGGDEKVTPDTNQMSSMQLSPYYPLIAPVASSQQDMGGFRPPPGSGIWGVIKDVIGLLA